MNAEQKAFILGFRISESIYIKPGQLVKSQAEILKEMPYEVEVKADKEYHVRVNQVTFDRIHIGGHKVIVLDKLVGL